MIRKHWAHFKLNVLTAECPKSTPTQTETLESITDKVRQGSNGETIFFLLINQEKEWYDLRSEDPDGGGLRLVLLAESSLLR